RRPAATSTRASRSPYRATVRSKFSPIVSPSSGSPETPELYESLIWPASSISARRPRFLLTWRPVARAVRVVDHVHRGFLRAGAPAVDPGVPGHRIRLEVRTGVLVAGVAVRVPI